MSFPVPPVGLHTEGEKDFVAVGGKWVEPKRFAGGWTNPAQGWQWDPIEQAKIGIAISGYVWANASRSPSYDVGFIAKDVSNNEIVFDSNSVPQAYVIISWGSNGSNTGDWNGVRAMVRGFGIPLNWSATEYHVKRDNPMFIDISLVAVGNKTYMKWVVQLQSDDDSEEVVWGFAYILKPIGDFRHVGFATTTTIDSCFIGARSY